MTGPRRRELVGVGLGFLAVICLFYFEVVFLNRTFLPFGYPGEVMGSAPPWGFSGTVRRNDYRLDPGASAWQMEPWARPVAASYADGQAPLWSTHQFFGVPLAAGAQAGVFDLFRVPALVTTHAWGWDLYYLAQAGVSLALTYLFAHGARLGVPGSLVVSLAYTFCGFMFIRGNNHYAEIYHVLPAILLGSERLCRGYRRSGVLILAASVAMSILGGMPEVTLLTFIYGALYGAFRLGCLALSRRSFRAAVGPALLLSLGWVVGIGLAAPMILPLAEYLPLSFNIHGQGSGAGLIALPVSALTYRGVPYIAGLPSKPLLASWALPLDDYSGSAVLLLAMVGALSLKRLGAARPVAIFALASALLWGAKIYGLPLVAEAGRLPLLSQTLIYIWATPLLSLSLALLAGAGVEAAALGRVDRRVATVALVLCALYIGASTMNNWEALRLGGRRHTLATVGLAGAAATLGWLCLVAGGAARRRILSGACCLVVGGELFVLAPHGVYSDRYDSLALPPYVAWLQQQQAQGQPFRVLSSDGLLYPNYASAFDLDDVRAIDGLYPARTWDFVHTFLSPTVTDRYSGGFGHPEAPTELFGNKWLNLSNVRYILRPTGQTPADVTLAGAFFVNSYPPTPAVSVAPVTIDGQGREALVERPPAEAHARVTPEAARPILQFWLGLDLGTAQPDEQSGTEFVVSVQSGPERTALFRRDLDPTRDPADRHWIAGAVDLTRYSGQPVDVFLDTVPLGDQRFRRAAWGGLQLAPVPDPGQFTAAYTGEISIWENGRALPRAFLVPSAVAVTTPAEAKAVMQGQGFDPSVSAVVEGAPPPGVPAGADARVDSRASLGSVRFAEYGQRLVRLAVEAPQPAVLVMTDSFYPGWSATVDGAEAALLPTDLAFRGVVLGPGHHDVRLWYRPTSFLLGLALACLALLLLAITVWPARRRAGLNHGRREPVPSMRRGGRTVAAAGVQTARHPPAE